MPRSRKQLAAPLFPRFPADMSEQERALYLAAVARHSRSVDPVDLKAPTPNPAARYRRGTNAVPRLFEPPPADESTLTVKQSVALRIIRESDGGLTGYDLGRKLHDYFGSHLDGRPDCAYCSPTGTDLAQRLKALGLVVQRAAGVYQDANAAIVDVGRCDPSVPDWPEGFGDAA